MHPTIVLSNENFTKPHIEIMKTMGLWKTVTGLEDTFVFEDIQLCLDLREVYTLCHKLTVAYDMAFKKFYNSYDTARIRVQLDHPTMVSLGEMKSTYDSLMEIYNHFYHTLRDKGASNLLTPPRTNSNSEIKAEDWENAERLINHYGVIINPDQTAEDGEPQGTISAGTIDNYGGGR